MQRAAHSPHFPRTGAPMVRGVAVVLRSPWAVLLGTALIAFGQWAWYRDVTDFWSGALLAGPGMLLVLVGTRPARRGFRSITPVATGATPLAAGLPGLLVALGGIGLCLYAGWSGVERQHPVWAYLALWLGGVALTIAGVVPLSEARVWAQGVGRSVRQERRTWLLLGVLLVAALLVRVVFLETVPSIQAGDEAQFAYEAISVARDTDWRFSPFAMGIWHHPRTVHTLMAASIELLGQTKTAARLPWALFGALTVPAVYWLGRTLNGRRVGWAAALFMLTFPVHVQFSRTGMDMTGDAFFATLALALLARAVRSGSRMDAALGGAAAGLTQYFYFAGRIVPVMLAVYLALVTIRSWREVWRRSGALIVFVLVFAVTVFPFFYGAVRDTTRPLNPRLNAVGVWQTETAKHAMSEGRAREFWGQQLHQGLMAYVQKPDESDVYGRYGALLGWFAGVPFLVGIAATLRCWRSADALILPLWVLAVATLGGVMLIDPPHYPRYIIATPIAAVLVGIGLVTVGTALARTVARAIPMRPRGVGQLRRALPVGLAIALAAANLVVYVFDYLPRPLLYGERTRQLNEVAAILDTFDGKYQVHTFSSDELSMSGTDIIRYLTPENAGVEYTGAVAELPGKLAPGEHAFVIAPGRLEEVADLPTWVPGGELHQYINPRTDRPLVYIYLVTVH